MDSRAKTQASGTYLRIIGFINYRLRFARNISSAAFFASERTMVDVVKSTPGHRLTAAFCNKTKSSLLILTLICSVRFAMASIFALDRALPEA